MYSDDFEGSPHENALQRLWSRRSTLSGGFLDDPEPTLLEDVFPAAGQDDDSVQEKHQQRAAASVRDTLHQLQVEVQPPVLPDIADCNESTAAKVTGAWIHASIVPGFKYRVRPLGTELACNWLFGGRALRLVSIGRGYSSRLTFEPDHETLNNNNNYFWSDSWADGFAFELEVVNPGDKFTVLDSSGEACAVLELLSVIGPQREIEQGVLEGRVEKTVNIQALAKVEWFEDGHATTIIPVSGIAVCVRDARDTRACVTRFHHVSLGGAARRAVYTLTAGVHGKWRRTTVFGELNIKYHIVGLEKHELPVIGTYVDPRVVPGFEYRIRLAGSHQPLFDHRPMRLLSVGRGYGKRLTFSSDLGCLNAADNYLWSDSHPEGLGLEPRAVHVGMVFRVEAAGETLGVATVFRADAMQQEVAQEIQSPAGRPCVVKHIHVDVTCHMTLVSTNERRDSEVVTMRVTARAIVACDLAERAARLIQLVDIGLDSQLFITQQDALTLFPAW